MPQCLNTKNCHGDFKHFYFLFGMAIAVDEREVAVDVNFGTTC